MQDDVDEERHKPESPESGHQLPFESTQAPHVAHGTNSRSPVVAQHGHDTGVTVASGQ